MSNTTTTKTSKPTVVGTSNGTTVVARSVERASYKRLPAVTRASDTACACFLVTVATRAEETTFAIVVEARRVRGTVYTGVISDNRYSGGGPEGQGLACTVALEAARHFYK